MSLVNVHNEWDPLEEIIVGTPINGQLPQPDISVQAVDFPDIDNPQKIPVGKFPHHIIEETEEDIEEFIDTLNKLSITVRRPEPQNNEKVFTTPHWSSDGLYTYCPRDMILAIGNTVIEAPSSLRCRYFETKAYTNIFIDYMKSGSRWISAPKPELRDTTYLQNNGVFSISEDEPLFDAANILRLGDDLLYLVSNSGNLLGAQWLQSTLGPQYTVHTCYNENNFKHIDTTYSFIREGTLIYNPHRVNDKLFPKVLDKWDKIACPKMVPTSFYGDAPLSSPWIGMNILMITPNLAIVEKSQIHLIKLLEKIKVDVIPLQLRHTRTLGGGFHCITCDIRRRGNE